MSPLHFQKKSCFVCYSLVLLNEPNGIAFMTQRFDTPASVLIRVELKSQCGQSYIYYTQGTVLFANKVEIFLLQITTW